MRLLKKFIDLLFPTTCVLCQHQASQDKDLCLNCQKILPWIEEACPVCAAPQFGTQNTCGNCLKRPPPFHKTTALFEYKAPIDLLITKLKFHHKLVYGRLMGELLADKLRKNLILPELLIPVPLHKKRLCQRGYNQAIEIAKPIVKQLKIPLSRYDCIRVKNTEAQSNLPAKFRYKNIKNAFIVNKPIQATHVAIIDDVITTGNTITELSNQLKKIGVTTIEIWCCARTTLIN